MHSEQTDLFKQLLKQVYSAHINKVKSLEDEVEELRNKLFETEKKLKDSKFERNKCAGYEKNIGNSSEQINKVESPGHIFSIFSSSENKIPSDKCMKIVENCDKTLTNDSNLVVPSELPAVSKAHFLKNFMSFNPTQNAFDHSSNDFVNDYSTLNINCAILAPDTADIVSEEKSDPFERSKLRKAEVQTSKVSEQEWGVVPEKCLKKDTIKAKGSSKKLPLAEVPVIKAPKKVIEKKMPLPVIEKKDAIQSSKETNNSRKKPSPFVESNLSVNLKTNNDGSKPSPFGESNPSVNLKRNNDGSKPSPFAESNPSVNLKRNNDGSKPSSFSESNPSVNLKRNNDGSKPSPFAESNPSVNLKTNNDGSKKRPLAEPSNAFLNRKKTCNEEGEKVIKKTIGLGKAVSIASSNTHAANHNREKFERDSLTKRNISGGSEIRDHYRALDVKVLPIMNCKNSSTVSLLKPNILGDSLINTSSSPSLLPTNKDADKVSHLVLEDSDDFQSPVGMKKKVEDSGGWVACDKKKAKKAPALKQVKCTSKFKMTLQSLPLNYKKPVYRQTKLSRSIFRPKTRAVAAATSAATESDTENDPSVEQTMSPNSSPIKNVTKVGTIVDFDATCIPENYKYEITSSGSECSEEPSDIDEDDCVIVVEAQEVEESEVDGHKESQDRKSENSNNGIKSTLRPLKDCGDSLSRNTGNKSEAVNSFDRLPMKEEPTYKYKEQTVRKKAERMQLQGFDCNECEKYYKELGLSNEEKQERLKKCSRHRGKFAPPPTPEHFWELDFPDTEECKARGYQNETQKAKLISKRRRPL